MTLNVKTLLVVLFFIPLMEKKTCPHKLTNLHWLVESSEDLKQRKDPPQKNLTMLAF